MDKSLQDLANCLKEAGKIVDRLSSDTGNARPGTSSSSEQSSSLLQSAMLSVSSTVQRARSMVQSSSARSMFSRLNQRERLRALSTDRTGPPNKKAKPQEKSFEFVLLSFEDQEDSESLVLDDDAIILRGFVSLNSLMSEAEIRKTMAESIQLKFPTIEGQDLEFLKANRRRLTKPVNTGDFTFKEIRLLAGQGSIYVKVKDGFECLVQPDALDKNSQDKDGTQEPKSPETQTPSSDAELGDDSLLHSVFEVKPVEKPEEKVEEKTELEQAVQSCIEACRNVNNPVEIVMALQKYIMKGRVLDPPSTDVDVGSTGPTNFMEVNRFDILKTAFEELDDIVDLRLTVQVAFYGEFASDFGGPRREFFRLCLQKIKEVYFDDGLRELLFKDYEKVGIIMALSILQNGPIPTFLPEEILQELFKDKCPSPCVASLRKGFQKLGLYEIGKALPLFLHLLQPCPTHFLTRKKLVSLLKPSFSEEGSNSHKFQVATYEKFSKYLREVASGRRFGVSLGDILQFTTGSNEEPLLGFAIPPSIQFNEAISSSSKWFFVPTANSCSQTLCLPTASLECSLPEEEDLFEVYDHAFKNTYFGLA